MRAPVVVLLVTLGCTRSPSEAQGPAAGGSAQTGSAVAPGTAAAPSGPGARVRFVAVGDTGKGNEGQYAVGRAMAAWCHVHGCDFVALLGDNVYPSGIQSPDDPRMEEVFVKPYAGLDVPFYVVLGNHDYGGNGSGTELEKAANEVGYARLNPKWKLPADHYRFSMGGVDFFVADTTRSFFMLDDDVKESFARWREASPPGWKLVLGHHPLRSNGRHGNAGDYDGVGYLPIASGEGVRDFLVEHVCGWADVYLSGHDHDLEWLEGGCGADPATELIVSGGGATATPVLDRPTTPSLYRAQSLGFLYVDIDGDTFTGSFIGTEQQLLFRRTFVRGAARDAGGR